MVIRHFCLAIGCAAVVLIARASPALAEIELGIYTGVQSAAGSTVSGNDPGGLGNFEFDANWEGNSSKMPPYYGLRATWWRSDRYGYGLEFTHAKVYADDQTKRDNGLQILEFTDGLNIFTFNVQRRWRAEDRRWTPYVLVGLGISAPHVEFETAGGKTLGYQLTGPAARWGLGIAYAINQKWSLFAEYGGTWSQNKADLDNGGTLETDIVTNAANLGISYSFSQ